MMPVPAVGQKAAPPPPVKAWFDETVRECKANGGKISGSPAWSEGYFNGDNLPDYVIEEASITCSEWGSSAFCGTLGCGHDIRVSLPGGYRTVNSITTFDIDIDRSVRPNRLLITGNDGKKVVWGWNAKNQELDLVAVGSTAASPAKAAPDNRLITKGFRVVVELTPAARAWYQRNGDRPVLLAIYQGTAKKGAPPAVVNPAEDVVMAGEDRIPLPVTGGVVQVSEHGLDHDVVRWIAGEPEVSMMVGQAKSPKSTDFERFLECGPASDAQKLSVVRAKGVRLRCEAPAS